MKKKDLGFLLIWPFVAATLAVLLNANTLLANILFLIIPSLYISYKYPGGIIKSGIFSLLIIPPVHFHRLLFKCWWAMG